MAMTTSSAVQCQVPATWSRATGSTTSIYRENGYQNTVEANYIGVDISGIAPLGEADIGVIVDEHHTAVSWKRDRGQRDRRRRAGMPDRREARPSAATGSASVPTG